MLLLSATISNGAQVHRWLKEEVGVQDAEFVQYSGRFINLQRHIWTEQSAEEGKAEGKAEGKEGSAPAMIPLHPCSIVTKELLAARALDSGELAFTSRDTFELYHAFEEAYPADVLAGLSPADFDGFQQAPRISLLDAKNYEVRLKAALQDLAASHSTQTDALLGGPFAPPTPAKDVPLYTVIKELMVKDMSPVICFQLDAVKCKHMLYELVTSLEADEALKQPNHRQNLEKQAEANDVARRKADKAKSKNKGGGSDDDGPDDGAFDAAGPGDIDLDAPHPDFMLAPTGKIGITSREFNDVLEALKVVSQTSKVNLSAVHPLCRALRRGIGLYN